MPTREEHKVGRRFRDDGGEYFRWAGREDMILEQRPEERERMSQTAIWQKEVQAKGTASFCLGTGTSLLVWDREEASVAGEEGGREGRDETGEVGKGQIIQGLRSHSEEEDFSFKGDGSPTGF